MRNWLKDNYVILTGASGGIGRELTKRFVVKYGAKVIGVGRNEEKMRALREELGDFRDAFSFRCFDVGSPTEWKDFQAYLQEKNIRPVLLINNAGAFPPLQKAKRSSCDVFLTTMQNNFFSVLYAVETISPLLVKKQKTPAIVNVCSSAALCTVVGTASYTASKSALKGYSEALQLEEKGKLHFGIIYPGTTATDLFRNDENIRNSAMGKIAASPQKMAKKMARRIYRRKKRSVLGWDARFMCFAAKLMPVKGPALIRWVMKISKSVAFTNIFNEE